MKKESIVKDFRNIPISGVYNMKEKSNFLVSKMMDIEDTIRISYNITSAEILENNTTKLNSLANISPTYIKERAIKSLHPDKSQTPLDEGNLTKWIFEFDSKYLLKEYLFNEIYTLNPQSPFRQIPTDNIPGDKIGKLCYDYIEYNILDRYRLKEFILWTSYFLLKDDVVPGTGTDPVLNPEIKLLSKTPVYSFHAIPNTTSGNMIESTVDKQKDTIALKQYNDGLYEVSYKQTKSSQFYTFLWYYDAIYERI